MKRLLPLALFALLLIAVPAGSQTEDTVCVYIDRKLIQDAADATIPAKNLDNNLKRKLSNALRQRDCNPDGKGPDPILLDGTEEFFNDLINQIQQASPLNKEIKANLCIYFSYALTGSLVPKECGVEELPPPQE